MAHQQYQPILDKIARSVGNLKNSVVIEVGPGLINLEMQMIFVKDLVV